MVGSDRSPWLADLCHEAGKECTSSGSTAACRQVWQRHLAVRPRLFDPAASPEDRRRSASYRRPPRSPGEDGTGRVIDPA